MSSAPKTKIVAAFGRRIPEITPIPDVAADATLEFAVEGAAPAAKPKETHQRSRRAATTVGFALVTLIVVAAGVYFKDRWQPTASAAGGSLRIESDPAGADVKLNGTARGATPLSVTMPAGKYMLSVQSGSNVKEFPVEITNGAVTVHHVTWADAAPIAPVVDVGSLSVATDPVGSQVIVDGQDRGAAPMTLRDIPVGQHRVVVRAKGATYSRTVQVEAGATASLFIGGSTGTASGWIAVTSPVSIQVFEGSKLIGTSDMDRIMLPGGDHDLELVSDAVGFRTTRQIKVSAGQTASIALDLPKAPLSINATPWAEVFIDGTRIGETPIGNLPQTLGPHEIVFRHPQLGERRQTFQVTMNENNRVSMDMRQR